MINCPQILKKKRHAKSGEKSLYYFKGEKAKEPNIRLLLEAFDGFHEGVGKGAGCVLSGMYYLGPTAVFEFHLLA